MSSSVVFAAFTDGNMVIVGECGNSHRGAAWIWSCLGEHYLGDRHAVWRDDNGDSVWALAKDPRLSETDRLSLLTTFDRAIVTREHATAVANALESFCPSTENLTGQASIIRKAIADGAIAIGWQATTVAENLWCIATPDIDEVRPYNIHTDVGHEYIVPRESAP